MLYDTFPLCEALPIAEQTSTDPVIVVGAKGAVAFKVIDFAALLPQPETAITDKLSVDGILGNLMVMLLESATFTLTSCEPVGKLQR
jgi:hypothetical protein